MADSGGIAAALVVALLGGGFIGAVVSAWRARKVVPAERDTIIATGAESAVQSLQRALEVSDRRVDELETENTELRESMKTLQAELNEVRQQLVTALRGANDAQQKLAALQARYDSKH